MAFLMAVSVKSVNSSFTLRTGLPKFLAGYFAIAPARFFRRPPWRTGARRLQLSSRTGASRAVMAVQSGNLPAVPAACAGGAMRSQRSPSTVRAIAPLRPTSQQTVSETAAPASQSSWDGLTCETHVFPASVERSIIPPFPARQRVEPDGAFNKAAYSCAGRKVRECFVISPVQGLIRGRFLLKSPPEGSAGCLGLRGRLRNGCGLAG